MWGGFRDRVLIIVAAFTCLFQVALLRFAGLNLFVELEIQVIGLRGVQKQKCSQVSGFYGLEGHSCVFGSLG